MDGILIELGYQGKASRGRLLYQKSQSKTVERQKRQRKKRSISTDKNTTSPFAKLKDLIVNP